MQIYERNASAASNVHKNDSLMRRYRVFSARSAFPELDERVNVKKNSREQSASWILHSANIRSFRCRCTVNASDLRVCAHLSILINLHCYNSSCVLCADVCVAFRFHLKRLHVCTPTKRDVPSVNKAENASSTLNKKNKKYQRRESNGV